MTYYRDLVLWFYTWRNWEPVKSWGLPKIKTKPRPEQGIGIALICLFQHFKRGERHFQTFLQSPLCRKVSPVTLIIQKRCNVFQVFQAALSIAAWCTISTLFEGFNLNNNNNPNVDIVMVYLLCNYCVSSIELSTLHALLICLAVRLLISYLTSLHLSFLICKLVKYRGNIKWKQMLYLKHGKSAG